MATVNNEEAFKEGAKSALGDQDHNGISPGSEQGGEMPAVPMDSNIAVYSGTVSATEKEKYKEQPNSLGALTTGETQDKSGEPSVFFLLSWHELVGHISNCCVHFEFVLLVKLIILGFIQVTIQMLIH